MDCGQIVLAFGLLKLVNGLGTRLLRGHAWLKSTPGQSRKDKGWIEDSFKPPKNFFWNFYESEYVNEMLVDDRSHKDLLFGTNIDPTMVEPKPKMTLFWILSYNF